MPAATQAAAPPEEPPGVIEASRGLVVAPCSRLRVNQRSEKAGVLVRPRITAPAFFRLATTGLSCCATRSCCRRQPVGGGPALLVDIDLHRDGHAGQRPGRLAAGDRRIHRRGGGQRLGRVVLDDGVEPGVHRIQPGQGGSGRLGGGDLPVADQGSEFRGRKAPEIGHEGCPGCLAGMVGRGAAWVNVARPGRRYPPWPPSMSLSRHSLRGECQAHKKAGRGSLPDLPRAGAAQHAAPAQHHLPHRRRRRPQPLEQQGHGRAADLRQRLLDHRQAGLDQAGPGLVVEAGQRDVVRDAQPGGPHRPQQAHQQQGVADDRSPPAAGPSASSAAKPASAASACGSTKRSCAGRPCRAMAAR